MWDSRANTISLVLWNLFLLSIFIIMLGLSKPDIIFVISVHNKTCYKVRCQMKTIFEHNRRLGRSAGQSMITSYNGNIFRVTGPLCGESTGHRWITLTKWRWALIFSLICSLNKRLSKQSSGWWFEKPSRSLWRHCNATRNHYCWRWFVNNDFDGTHS